MKIFLAYSQVLPKNYSDTIVNTLSDLGHNIFLRQRPKDYKLVSKADAERITKESVAFIKKSDVVFVEVSFASVALGYLISAAIFYKKPIIAIYSTNDFKGMKNVITKLPLTLKGIPSNNLLIYEYNNNSLKKVVIAGLNESKSLLFSKFNFLISPKISNYLEWGARYFEKSKSEIVRMILENHIDEDKEYKKNREQVEDLFKS